MSGLAKGIGKVFRGVFSAVKKIALPLVAVGAAVFTGGASLGLGGLAAGGWGGAVSSGLAKLGFSSTGLFGKILTGAVTQAGRGALLGGITGAISGQGFAKGARMGALGGALLGGLSSAFTPAPVAAAGGTAAPTAASVSAPQTGIRGLLGGGGTTTMAGGAGTDMLAAGGTAAPGGVGGMVRGLLGNGGLGEILTGAAQGYMQGRVADEQRRQREAEQARVTNSYDVDPSSLRWWENQIVPTSVADPPSSPATATAPAPDMTPAAASQDMPREFRPRAEQGPRRFQWNPETRRIEYG